MQSAPIDTQLVRKLFSRPERIAASDFLRREVAQRMREKLELVKINPATVLDAGCGDGADLAELQRCYPSASIIGLDAALPMLQQSARRWQESRGVMGRLWSALSSAVARSVPDPALLGGDFGRLPLAGQSLDLIWSNLALHWHPQPDLVFAEWRRVLKTDGLLMFSCFGPDTLKELKQAFAAVDQSPHVLPFVDMHDFGDMLVNAGFSTPVMDMEQITLTYTSTDQLLAEVRALGGNPLLSRRRGLTGKQMMRALHQQLEQLRQPDGRIALTLELVYGHAFRPVTRKTSAGEAIIHFKK